MANKPLFWVVTILLLLIAVFVLTTTVVLPVVTKNPLPEAISRTESKPDNNVKKSDKGDVASKKGEKSDKGGKKTESKAQDNQVKQETASTSKDEVLEYFEVKKKETFLKVLYTLAAEDSIYLVLDLQNNVATIEMKGIPLHDSPLKSVWISNSIKLFHTEALIKWMSLPFVMKSAVSTIERVPFLVKNAPKDTIEANKAEAVPAPRKTEDVFITMNFERNLQLVIQQSELSEGIEKTRIDSLKRNIFKRESEKSIKALASLKRDAVTPKIVITLPKTDAITLYRALPQRLKMVIKM